MFCIELESFIRVGSGKVAKVGCTYTDSRKYGYGSILVTHAENELKKLSVPYIYLTSDDSIDFWLSLGYTDTGEICDKNDCNILIKQVIYN